MGLKRAAGGTGEGHVCGGGLKRSKTFKEGLDCLDSSAAGRSAYMLRRSCLAGVSGLAVGFRTGLETSSMGLRSVSVDALKPEGSLCSEHCSTVATATVSNCSSRSSLEEDHCNSAGGRGLLEEEQGQQEGNGQEQQQRQQQTGEGDDTSSSCYIGERVCVETKEAVQEQVQQQQQRRQHTGQGNQVSGLSFSSFDDVPLSFLEEGLNDVEEEHLGMVEVDKIGSDFFGTTECRKYRAESDTSGFLLRYHNAMGTTAGKKKSSSTGSLLTLLTSAREDPRRCREAPALLHTRRSGWESELSGLVGELKHFNLISSTCFA